MNLKQNKFPLAVVINLLAAITFGYFCFLGTNFYTLGDKDKSITYAVIIILLLIGTSLGAKFLKQTKRNFKSRFVWEIISLVLFTVIIGYLTYTTFSHYFVVSENETEIQSKLNLSITQAENMYNEYEQYVDNRKNNYEANLNSAILTMNGNNSDFIKYDFMTNSIPYDKQIIRKMRTIGFDLMPSNYNSMKSGNLSWLAKSKESVENWKPIGLVDVINNIETFSNNWKSDLINTSKIREKGEENEVSDFTYKLTLNQVTKYFTTQGNPTPTSIVYSLLVYVIMLLPYVLSNRSTKSSVGFSRVFYKKTIKTNKFDIKY